MEEANTFIDTDNKTFVLRTKAIAICNVVLSFTQEQVRNRFQQRIQKIVSKNTE